MQYGLGNDATCNTDVTSLLADTSEISDPSPQLALDSQTDNLLAFTGQQALIKSVDIVQESRQINDAGGSECANIVSDSSTPSGHNALSNNASSPPTQKNQEVLNADQQKLILDNMGIATFVAKKFYGTSFTEEDLISEAQVGVALAAVRFDPSRGIKFTTFATSTAIGYVRNAIRDRDRLIRGTREDREEAMSYRAAVRTLLESGQEVTPAAIREISGLSDESITNMQLSDAARHPQSVNPSPRNESSDQSKLLVLADDHTDAGAEHVENRLLLEKAIESLADERLRDIILMRYGLPPYKSAWTQQEVGQKIGLSQMQVSRLEKQALGQLKDIIVSIDWSVTQLILISNL